MTSADEIFYRRVLFRTRLLGDRLYTPSHFWVKQDSDGVWRVGLTKFASRMLGDIVEIGFDVVSGARVDIGDTLGWFEGFKARSDLYAVVAGTFRETNPLLIDRIAVVDDDRYRRGWLYSVHGAPDPQAMDMHAYARLLDDTIDRMRGGERQENAG